ncbi:MAG: hypothetical protein Q7Q73_01130 [Verrucomicrobiota bacterium JB024]|nr:hypothetical protein [Verrucomicrobiota bacterium JB024]
MSARLTLFLDASSVTVQAGLWRDNRWLAHRAEECPALESIFSLVEGCLNDAGETLEAVGRFVHCEGPGSVLGIRLAAMAIRTWRALPAWEHTELLTCRSLPLAAALIARTERADGATFHVIAEARQTRWNVLPCPGGTIAEVEPDAIDALTGAIYHLSQRKSWHTPPAHAVPVSNNLSAHPELLSVPGLLAPADAPGLFMVSEATYRTWTPERHRAG